MSVTANRLRRSRRQFLPNQVAGLAVWFAADQLRGLADDDPMATWPDTSGNGRDAAQSDSAKRPAYKTGILNSRPVVRFDGTDDCFDTGTFTLAQPNTIIVVVKHDDALGDKVIIDGNGATNRNIITINGGNWRIYAGTFVGATAADTAWHVHTGLFNGASSVQRLDGTQTATGNAGAASIGGLRIGGWSDGGTGRLDGDIAEVCVYNAALSVPNQQLVERHLGAKYGITVA